MSYHRFIQITNNKDELYQLAIMADFAEMTYSVVVVHFNHTHTAVEHHVVETFYTVFEATREFHRLVGERQQDKDFYQKLFETAKEKGQLYL